MKSTPVRFLFLIKLLLIFGFFSPQSVLAGQIYVASFLTSELTKIDIPGGTVDYSIAHGSRGTIDVINGLDDDLYVSRFWSNNVVSIDPQTGAEIAVVASGGNLDAATGIALGDDGYLYVASRDSHEIKKYRPQTGEFVSNVATIQSPEALLFKDGELLVTQFGNSRVTAFDVTNGNERVFAEHPSLQSTRQMALGPDGFLYVAGLHSNNVVRFDATTGAFEDEFLTGIHGANGLAFDEQANLFVASELGHLVSQFAPNGMLLDTFPVRGPIGVHYVPEPTSNGPFCLCAAVVLFRFRRRVA